MRVEIEVAGRRRLTGACLALCLLAGAVPRLWAQQAAGDSAGAPGPELTVYNQDLGLVREVRRFDLHRGINDVLVQDVAARIDPTSVAFESLTDSAGTRVLEQNFEYDLVSPDRLLQKYLDREITVQTEDGSRYTGRLLSTGGAVVLQGPDGKVTSVSPSAVQRYLYPELPEGLRTRPTLVWKVDARKAGQHRAEITYLTHGIDWSADYVLLLGADEKAFDLDGWVTLDNQSGGSYENAKLKLVAGQIHQAPQEARPMAMGKVQMQGAAVQAEERGFFEYHLYEIPRRVTVRDRQTKQVQFVTARRVPVTKSYVFDAASARYGGGGPVTAGGYGTDTTTRHAQVELEFRTDAKSGLETQLPAGRVRIYKRDVDGSSLLIGEDRIDHTPKDEAVRLTVGQAFDVVGDRTRTDFQRLGEHAMEESFHIELRNHKEEDVLVRVVEHLYRWSNWSIVKERVGGSAGRHHKLDAQTVEWKVPVAAGDSSAVDYTVRYSW